MVKIRLKPELFTLLTSGKMETFTAVELTNAYLRLPNSQKLTKQTARQFVLRNLKRLEIKGYLEEIGGSSYSVTKYRLASNFNRNCVTIGKPHLTAINEVSSSSTNFEANLKDKLKDQKQELGSIIGEIEEYELVSNETPLERDYIQGLYNQARDRYSKTIGRIRALESLISHY
ncbi:hypothetical protein A9Q99_05755 [Gammaproteobacteria bacterium 45_16_T64]|nr:hypothetical protein A9Q99_05755 [Gammaproteobacteria bacterium 45_16_T64]